MSNQSQKSDNQKKIAEQFAGLDMENLIGSPLNAAAEAQSKLASAAVEFLEEMNSHQSTPKAKPSRIETNHGMEEA